ncbi:MAG: ATP-binding protein [Lachnospiraceae bacterium]|nr:ATP-binding protein [Lachnospiraceae bacterium]
MIGRKEEISVLEDCLRSKRPEFLIVYGRRRVGKTYLVREYFNHRFSFYATGISGQNTKKQIKVFHEALSEYGDTSEKPPADWIEAFSRLRKVLEKKDVIREQQSGKRVIFLDELPWMDTARSDFKSALDYFWNSYGSAQKDLLLIACGSATSWIIDNIVRDTGGFYHRITRQIHLQPFSLGECMQLLEANGMQMSHRQIIESYMVFGGVPYYLNYLKPSLSLAQNIDVLFFGENSPLKYEFDHLFSSLYKNAGRYTDIIRALHKKRGGLTRQQLAGIRGIVQGKELTKCLKELEQCGFVRKYNDFTTPKNGCHFQLTDALSLFHLSFLEHQKAESWLEYIHTPGYYAWCGLAFERVCLQHTRQIKSALGIAGISSHEYAWKSKKASPGAQVDLLIDRKDDVINLCEIKYTAEVFQIDVSYHRELVHKTETFREETRTKKAILLTMISCEGIRQNKYSNIVVKELTGNDLFGHD